jgi:hypothetical protein
MKIVRFLAAAAAIGGIAAPLAAQSAYPYGYPQQSYAQQPYAPAYPQAYPQQYPQAYPQSGYAYPGQQGYGGTNVVSQVINQLLGNRYNVTDRTAVSQCASAALTQSATSANGYNGYNAQPYANQRAYRAQGSARVTAITNVERRNNGLRVTGLIDSGMYGAYRNNGYGQGYGQGGYPGQAYNANTAADLRFRCNVDYRGAVTNVRINRNTAWRG